MMCDVLKSDCLYEISLLLVSIDSLLDLITIFYTLPFWLLDNYSSAIQEQDGWTVHNEVCIVYLSLF